MIRVVVVEDHPVVREGLKHVLCAHPDITVVGEAGDGQKALDVLRNIPCDVVLLDLMLPKKDGLEVLQELRSEMIQTPVLVLSMHNEDEWAPLVLRAGAFGYLMKNCAPENLVSALRRVARGGRYVTPALAEKLAFGSLDRLKHSPSELLSHREYQVLLAISSGRSVTHIADELRLSVKTVSTYRGRILEKLSLRNNAELTRYAIQQGVPEQPLSNP